MVLAFSTLKYGSGIIIIPTGEIYWGGMNNTHPSGGGGEGRSHIAKIGTIVIYTAPRFSVYSLESSKGNLDKPFKNGTLTSFVSYTSPSSNPAVILARNLSSSTSSK